jgi:hypothetical protein
MSPRVPPIASGYRGSRTNNTLEDNIPNQVHFSNSCTKSNTNFGRTTRVATNLRSYFIPVNRDNMQNDLQGNQRKDSYNHGSISTRGRHSCHGSCWTNSEAACKFRAQSEQFNTGTKAFRARIRPSTSQLITKIHKENRSTQIRNTRSKLAAFAYQISLHEQHAQNQESLQIADFFHKPAYGKAPREKPDNCVCLMMENFNSLGIFTKGTKINSLNKLCQQFNTNILAGCETQADWRQATKEQQFRNIIGVGMETRSIISHNINKWMQCNQHSGCAMMAMKRFSAKVVESEVDPSGLCRWCWLKVGSGNKRARIVMAYQPSGSKSTNSAGTTVREQHERYFEARGDLHSARTIFFEQLIAQLIVWKHTKSNIVLLGDFNENKYSGCISKYLSQPDLMFSKQCSNVPAFISPQHLGMAQFPLMLSLPLPVLNASMHTSSHTKEVWAIIDAS